MLVSVSSLFACSRIACRPTRSLLYISSPSLSAQRHASLFKTFLDNVKKEANKDEELKASVKQFEEKLTDIKENKTLHAFKSALSNAKKEVVEQNQAVFSELKEKYKKVESTVSTGAEKVSQVVETTAAPIRKLGRHLGASKASKTLSKASVHLVDNRIVSGVSSKITQARRTLIDDAESIRYGGFMSRELREQIRQEKEQLAKEQQAGQLKVEENPDAGASLVLHKESAWKQKWSDFRDNNTVLRGIFEMKRNYDESNNIFVYYARAFTSTISGALFSVFRETETAQVIKEINQLDPSFKLETFLKDAREYIIPEILESFLRADLISLKPWCGEAVYNVLKANVEATKKPGWTMDGKVYDLRGVDLVTAKIVGDHPVLVLSFHTQQTAFAKDMHGKIVDGSQDKVESMFYVWALAKSPETDPVTGGWKLIEMAMRASKGGF